MKRRMITMLLGVILLSLIVTYFKEENQKISYGLNDNPIAVMIYDEEQNTYVKKSNVPIGNYRLNEDKSYCTNGGEINHYNWATGTIQYTLDIGEKCYLYFYEETTPSYAIYSETDNSLIFYKNNDTVGSTYNGRVVTAKYDDIENSVYTYDSNTATPNTPWYEYASVIKTVSVADEIMPISTASWFHCFSNAENIVLTNLNTSQVTNMERMFDKAGQNSSNFTLDLGSDFDTSNVITMFCMFQWLAYESQNFILDLGSKFDTSNVTNMMAMFNYVGLNSLQFSFDLGDKFDTSNVTNMSAMFQRFAENSTNYTLNLGSKFDTSKVTNMSRMFTNTGAYAENFQLILGPKFDTSNVENMYAMFSATGKKNSNFVLDVSSFNVLPNCDLTNFAYNSASKIIFGEGWGNATLVAQMFYRDALTPLEIVNAPANIQSYDFAADNRVVTFTTI